MATLKEFKYNIDKFEFRNKKDTEEEANGLILSSIKKQLKEVTDPFTKLLVVTDFLTEITNRDLLLKTKSLFSDIDFSELSEKISSKINIEKYLYSENQITRVFAIIIGNYIRYERMKPKDSKEFSFEIKGNKIKVSKIDYGDNFKRIVISAIPNILKNNIKAYDQLIGVMDKTDFDRGTDYLEREIKFLERQRNSISASETKSIKTENINPYPRILVSFYAFQVFDNYSKTINEKHQLADYSFLYRKMIEDNLIFKSVGDSEFRLWLGRNYQIEIDKTKQLYLCTTSIKEGLYSTIKDSINQ